VWEIGYTITPDRGHFDRGERALWRAGISQQAIRSLEFVADGTVVLVYEFDCSAARLESVLGDGGGKVVDYAITKGGDRPDEPLVAQIRLRPGETLQRVLSVHRSFGVSVSFPIRYLRHDPATIEIVETGPRAELSERIAETRAFASVEVSISAGSNGGSSRRACRGRTRNRSEENRPFEGRNGHQLFIRVVKSRVYESGGRRANRA